MNAAATCHCGAITLEIPEPPTKVTECNCSICRRLGALWVYHPPEKVAILHGQNATSTYVWGDRTLEFCSCRICSCTTHWLPLIDDYKVMGVNARMIDGLNPSEVEVIHEDFGGAGCFWS